MIRTRTVPVFMAKFSCGFHLLSSMCRTSEIDRRCVHLRGSDRCEISYAVTLTPVDVRGSDRCEFYIYAAIQLYANYAEGLHFSAFHYHYYDHK